jgi:nitrous oxidase accessory protein NosD
MSYTLRGRIETRLAAMLLPFLAACIASIALSSWWPLELTGVMVAAAVGLDTVLYHRLLSYQPGWLAVPLGLLELGVTMGLVRALGIAAPLLPALWFFAGSWLVAQLLTHAGLPLLRLTYAEDGGELGSGGVALTAATPLALGAVLWVGWLTLPPLVHLSAGMHKGPLVLDSPQRLVGEDGAVVQGGIVIRSDDVSVRNVTVVGGENGIDVDLSHDIVLDDVRVIGSTIDGIHVRRSHVTIRDCEVASLASEYGQGIDISFSFDRDPSLVDGCSVHGAWEGIVSHSSRLRLVDNTVRATTSRGIAVTEMSMGAVERNNVESARGVGIFCGDYSMCDIERNRVSGTTPDHTTEDAMRAGYAIQAHFYAQAELDDNHLEGNAQDYGAFAGGRFGRR